VLNLKDIYQAGKEQNKCYWSEEAGSTIVGACINKSLKSLSMEVTQWGSSLWPYERFTIFVYLQYCVSHSVCLHDGMI